MSWAFGDCEREGREDARRGSFARDDERYHGFSECSRDYRDGYDAERRSQERREEERAEEERAERRAVQRRREEREQEEDYWASQQQQEQGYPEPSGEELCAHYGHPRYGEDVIGPRCYCGLVRCFVLLLTWDGPAGGGAS